jgi:hypothetical protein
MVAVQLICVCFQLFELFPKGFRGLMEIVSHIKGERFMGANFYCVMDQRATTEFSGRRTKKKFPRHFIHHTIMKFLGRMHVISVNNVGL